MKKYKVDDIVIVITGKDKGKTGQIISLKKDKVIIKDVNKYKATGIITVLFDDRGPIIDYFAGSVNLNSAYVLMDQLKGVILDKIEQAQEGIE